VTGIPWIIAAAALWGVALLTGLLNGGASGITAIGVAAGIASALSYALFILSFQNAAARGAVPATLAIAFSTFVVVLALLVDHDQVIAALHSTDLVGFLLLGVLGVGLSFAVYLPGLRRTPASLASMIASLGALAHESGLGARIAHWLLDALPLGETGDAATFGLLGGLAMALGTLITLPGVPAVLTPLAPDEYEADATPAGGGRNRAAAGGAGGDAGRAAPPRCRLVDQ